MKPHLSLSAVLSSALLLGCDAGKEPYAKAAEAEAAGNFAEAAALYRSACEKASSRCGEATKRVERFKLKEAWKAIDEGRYGKAKEALDAAAASSDAGVKRAAEATSKLSEFALGLTWEEASALADKAEALAKIEPLAKAGAAVSPKAQEWLAKNRGAVLIEQIRAACAPAGKGSCAQVGKQLAVLHGASPEDAEAQKLVEADYARIYPLLKQAENLLIQRVGLHDRDERIKYCTATTFGSDLYRQCESMANDKMYGDAQVPTVEFLAKAWGKKLDEIHDPYFVKQLEDRWKLASDLGENDPTPWPGSSGPSGTRSR